MTEAKKVQAVGALRKCAKEHEKDVTYTGNVIVTNMCNDVADYVEELQAENAELKERIEKMKCCLNCKKWRYYANYPLCAEKSHFVACESWEMKE